MPSSPSAKPTRPLSPHLQVYRPQLTSMLSIMHRATGVGLALGLVVFTAWVTLLAANQKIFDAFGELFQNPVGQVLLFGWSWAFFYHFCTGMRHLFWDAGYFLGIKNVYRTGWLALAISTLVTGYAWFDIENGDWQTAGIVALEFIGAIIALGVVALAFLWVMGLLPDAPKKKTSMRGQLAKARGLGAAKEGTGHWWGIRVTAAALALLSTYVVGSFFYYRVYGDYNQATIWLDSPFTALAVMLFVGAGYHHAANGIQEVIEDYVHGEKSKLLSILAVKFVAIAFAALAVLATFKVLFFAILMSGVAKQ